MLSFEQFTESRSCEDFTQRMIKATDGYADIMQIGTSDNHQIWKCVINPDGKRTVAFVAGLHGNEPGGPEGVLKFFEDKPHIPKNKKVIIIPLVNPTGFKANTRKNKEGEDLNRNYFDELTGERKFVWEALEEEDLDLLHTLHEDPELSAFYMYYTHNKSLAEDIRELAKKYFKIYEENGELRGDKITDGLISLPHVKRGTIEDKMLVQGVPYFTTETPGQAPLIKRTKFTKEAMKLVIHGF